MLTTGNEFDEQSPSPFDRSHKAEQSSKVDRRRELLARWADLIAIGKMPFPGELSAEEIGYLVSEVSMRRCRRLVHTVAMAIARSIWCDEGGRDVKEPYDD